MSLIFSNKRDRGDTLIEVLFAITIFSSVAVASIAIMNQGAEVAQRSLEITLVRQEIDSQAETLRFLNAAYISAYQSTAYAGGIYVAGSYSGAAEEWRKIRDNNMVNNDVSAFGSDLTCGTPNNQYNSFVLDTNHATVVSLNGGYYAVPLTYSQVYYGAFTKAYGIWIEAKHSTTIANDHQDNAGYIDFYIRACWFSTGQSMPITTGTIVRLYEPI